MTSSSNRGNKPKPMQSDRWRPHPDRWSTNEAAEAALDAYAAALKGLVDGDHARAEYTETERLALKLGQYLGATLALGLTFRDLKAFREAVAPFERAEGLNDRRCRAVEAVAAAGAQYLKVDNDEGRLVAVRALASALSGSDEAFEGAFGELNVVPLTEDLTWLEERLKPYDPVPKGKKNKKGAETILAEIIALDLDSGGALGLSAAEGESDEVAVERIRVVLASAVTKVLAEPKESKKTE